MKKKKLTRSKKMVKGPRKNAIAASKGNQWWKRRSKHGRDKLFASPELLWEAVQEYFAYEDKGRSFMNGQKPVAIPYTLTGLCLYLDCTSSYFRAFKSSRKDSTNQIDKDFITIIHKIEDAIYNQQFNGASGGKFNSNIIARSLGLVDRQDVTSGDAPVQAPVINIVKGENVPPLK